MSDRKRSPEALGAGKGDRRPEGAISDRPLTSDALPSAVECPFCSQDDTEQFAAFGGQVSTSQYYCNRCRTVFDAFRWR